MKSLTFAAAWLLVPIAEATNYQRMINVHMDAAGLVLKRDDEGCQQTYGGGSVVCGDQDSEFCYDPSIGESCCPLDSSYCNAGEYCATIPGLCCKDGEDLLSCATRQGVSIPASLPPVPASLPPIPESLLPGIETLPPPIATLPPTVEILSPALESLPPSLPITAAGLPMAGTEFPLPTITPGPETVGLPLLQSATEPVVDPASLFASLETLTASDILPTTGAVSLPIVESSDIASTSTSASVEEPPYPIASTSTVTIPIETKAPLPTVIPINTTTSSPPVVTYTGAAKSLQPIFLIAIAGFLAGWVVG